MKRWLRGSLSLIGLSLCEARRQRLWLVLLVAVLVLLLGLPRLRAVDEGAQLKLAVTAMSTVVAFVTTLLALGLAATAYRRDHEQRITLTLFTKPLPRGAYLLGRWAGVQVLLLFFSLSIAGLGAGAIIWQLQRSPQPVEVLDFQRWWRVDHGEAIEVPDSQKQIFLNGNPRLGQGQGARLLFTGIDATAGLHILIRGQVGGISIGRGNDYAQIRAVALDSGGRPLTPLQRAATSPYGAGPDGTAPPELVWLRDRRAAFTDLDRDYVRIAVPPEAVVDGALLLQLQRLNTDTYLAIDRQQAVLLARPAGSFISNVGRAQLVVVAQAGLLGAAALFLAVIGSVAIALLGGLTLYFAGLAISIVIEDASPEDVGNAAARFLELLAALQPDFSRYRLEEALASNRLIEWETIGSAWVYYGGYSLVFLIAAWLVLRRQEQ